MPTPTPTPRSTLTSDYQRNWPEYFTAVAGKPPRQTLVRALDAFEREEPAPAPAGASGQPRTFIAVDIATGEGRDAREILRRTCPRWSVLATDVHPEAVRLSMAKVDLDHLDRLAVAQVSMEDLPSHAGLPRRVDLVNASFALPFCKPESFAALWGWITTGLRPGGRFAGQFFGQRDEWASVRPQSHFTRAQVEKLLACFDIEWLDEVLCEGDDATGKIKMHHVFHVVARKR